ncbi:MAG: hypothetical protein SPF77_03440 [Gemmiger sp.]|uniref:glycine-rich domain-containing protein n=1 Tax=Gemmiger sp. TaxID=2049027 RepID=UPI002A90BCA3|nr:hypothetical protein [Gemmiger sp.]MDY5501618.1 hypothetical protein [Gemmiger sp.]
MATWNGVITNAGNSLLNEWVNEKTLNFDSAASGQGTVAEVAMMAQTALVNEKQVASLLGGEKVASGIRLKLRIAAPDTAYTLNQFRVSASVDGGSPAMLALFQLEQGIPIPSKTESPDFVYTFYALISCSNTGTWTVTVDTSACVTQGDMTAAITEAVKTKQDKLTGTPGQVVGFDEEGNAVPQAGGGVTTFNGRSGAVVPSKGDYTAEMVGARPESWIPSAADTGAVPITEKGAPNGVATLGPDGKVPAGQLPKMDYDPSGSAAAVQQALTAHTGNKNNPHAVTAEQVGALASSGGVMSGAISMSGHKIANLAAPTDLTDAAHKSYVDEHVDQTLKQKLGYKLIKEYTSPGSYTHKFDRKYTDVFVVVVGAGGGGGSSGERGGGGGGGGAVACFHVLDSSTIQNNNIVVGTGGAGAVSSLGPSVTNNGSAGGSSSAFGITVPGGSGGIANLGGMGGGYAPNEIVPGWLMIGGSGGSHNNNGDGDGNAGPIISIVGFKPFGGGGGGGGNPSLNDPPTPGGNGGDGGAGNGGAGATGQSNAIMGKNGTRGGGGGGGGAGWTFRSSGYKPSGIGGKGGDGYVAIYGRE